MTITELIKELEFNRKIYGDNIEIAVWHDKLKDYLDFYFRYAAQRKSKSDWSPGKLFLYIHPIVTDKKFHYYEFTENDNN